LAREQVEVVQNREADINPPVPAPSVKPWSNSQ